ncbi:MAG: hypothetical protein H6Q16_956 [Bacteroidetes bacterium]|nr:hypothetical protein [Bacteroidota bacterium]
MEDSKFVRNPWLFAGFISIILAAVLFMLDIINFTASISLIALSIVCDLIAVIQFKKKSKDKEEEE